MSVNECIHTTGTATELTKKKEICFRAFFVVTKSLIYYRKPNKFKEKYASNIN